MTRTQKDVVWSLSRITRRHPHTHVENWVMRRGSHLDQIAVGDIGDDQVSSCPEGIKTKAVTGSQTASWLGNVVYSLNVVPQKTQSGLCPNAQAETQIAMMSPSWLKAAQGS